MLKCFAFIFPFHNKIFCFPFLESAGITNILPQFSGKFDKCMDVFFTHTFPNKRRGSCPLRSKFTNRLYLFSAVNESGDQADFSVSLRCSAYLTGCHYKYGKPSIWLDNISDIEDLSTAGNPGGSATICQGQEGSPTVSF